jgi:exosome complex component RRP43
MENASAAIIARAAAAARAQDTATAAAGGADDTHAAEAFRRLYPAAFLKRFLRQGVRPDGRRPAACRPATIALGALSRAAAAGSALARLSSTPGSSGPRIVGGTAALAGVRLEVMCPTDEAPDRGGLAVSVEFAPLASPAGEGSRAADQACAAVIAERLRELLLGGGGRGGGATSSCAGPPPLVDTRQLCIDPGRAAWAAYLDVVVLDASGSAADACLLAALAALGDARLPRVRVTGEGNVEREEGEEGEEEEMEADGRRLSLRGGAALPASSTTFAACRLPPTQQQQAAEEDDGGGNDDSGVVLLADPTAEEEAVAQALVTVTVDEEAVLGVAVAPGGGGGGGGDALLLRPAALLRCTALARARGRELGKQLEAAAKQQAGS